MKYRFVYLSVLVLSILVIVHLFSACDRMGTAKAEPLERGLLTGECLKSDNLKTTLKIASERFNFAVALDMDSKKESLPEGGRYRRIPSPAIFQVFGDKNNDIQSEYDRLFNDFNQNQEVYLGLIFASTIFYDDGMTLTADKDFAGHPAGENLIPYCIVNERAIYTMESVYLPPKDGYSSRYMIPYDNMEYLLSYPFGNHSVVEDDITFTLKIPVKVGMYLSWLNNRLTDPSAEIHYEERVLKGEFNIGKGLH